MGTKQWIGVDVSMDSLKIACPEGQTWQIETVENTTARIGAWIRRLDKGQVHIILEATGTYSDKVAQLLHRMEVSFSVITPRQASQFSGVLKNITKNDERDACCLSLFGQHMQPAVYQMPSRASANLKQLRTLLGQLKKQRQALFNQRHALEQLEHPLQLALDLIDQTLGHLNQQIQVIENEVCTQSDEAFHSLMAKACTIKGIGPKTALALLVATDGLKHFDDVKQLTKFVGLAPQQYQSGKSATKAFISRAADPELRTLFYMATWSACKSNKACIELRKKLKNKGKPPKVILIAVAHKLLRQIWGVIKNGAVFDNDYESKAEKT